MANINSITAYRRTASGNVLPLRTISGELTQLDHPLGLGLDAVNNEVVVANFGSNHRRTVTVYEPDGERRYGTAACHRRGQRPS